MKKEVLLKKSFAPQHDHKDCGAACLLTLVRWFGYQTSLEHLRMISGTTHLGASLLGLEQAASQLGFEAGTYRASMSELRESEEMYILHVVKHEVQNHFVLCMGKDNGKWLIADPEDGIQHYTDKQLQLIWTEGVLLRLNYTGNLQLKRKDNQSISNWFWPLLKAHSAKLTFILVLGLLHSLLLFSTSVFTEKLVDELLPSQDKTMILTGISIWAALLLISLVLSQVRNYGIAQFSRDFNTDLIRDFFSKLLYLPKRFFDSKKTGDLLTRMEDVEGIEETATKWVEEGVLSIFTLVVSIVLLFIYDIELAMISVFLLPVLFATVLILRKKVISKQREAVISHALNNANYVDAISGIDTVKRQQLEVKFSENALRFYRTFRKKVFASEKVNLNFGLAVQFLVFVTTVLIISVSSIKVLSDSLEIGNMLAIISITSIASANTTGLAFTYLDFEEAKIAFERMYELINQKTEESASKYSFEATSHNVISIHNLSFSFPGQQEMLSDISMELEQGKLVTLFGDSGSGKTTLINLMSTLYQPHAGRILFNGHNVYKNTLDWRGRIGVVPQDIKIFNASFWENINLEALGTQNQQGRVKVESLIKTHGLEAVFTVLPFGIDTVLGEGGVRLSGGQCKILGLLRAIFHQPLLLLLDEVTASLDHKNVVLIQKLIQQFKADIPILQITHNRMTATESDYVYLLEKGKIKYEGHPKTLFSKDNLFDDSLQAYAL